MSTNFTYITHETPRVPVADTATKRVFPEAHDRRPERDTPVTRERVDRPTAKREALALRAARRMADGIKGRR